MTNDLLVGQGSILFEREDALGRVAAEFDVGIDKGGVSAAFLAFRPFDAPVRA